MSLFAHLDQSHQGESSLILCQACQTTHLENPCISIICLQEKCQPGYRITGLQSMFPHSCSHKQDSQHRFLQVARLCLPIEKGRAPDAINHIVMGFRGTWFYPGTPANLSVENGTWHASAWISSLLMSHIASEAAADLIYFRSCPISLNLLGHQTMCWLTSTMMGS